MVLEMTLNAGCVKSTMKQSLTLFPSVLNLFKKNTNDNMTGWGRLCIEIFLERKAFMFPRNSMNTNLYLVQEMSLKIIWDFNIQTDIQNSQSKHIKVLKACTIKQVDSRNKEKGSKDLQNPPQIIEEPNMKEKIKWDNEKKANGEIGFMERLKIAWDECYPEFIHLTVQCLRENAERFKKDKTFINLILVRNREKITEELIKVPNDINNKDIERNDNRAGRQNQDITEENE